MTTPYYLYNLYNSLKNISSSNYIALHDITKLLRIKKSSKIFGPKSILYAKDNNKGFNSGSQAFIFLA